MAEPTVLSKAGPAARRLMLLAGWILGLALGLVLFHRLGAGPLQPPPLASPGQWSTWAAQREPLHAVMAVLRLVVLALSWYLVGVTTIALVAQLSRFAGLLRLAELLTVPVLRRGLQAVLGLGLATAVVGASVPGLDGSTPPRTAVAASSTVTCAPPPAPAAGAHGGTGVRRWDGQDGGQGSVGSGAGDAGGEQREPPAGPDADGAGDPLPLQLLSRAGTPTIEVPSDPAPSSPGGAPGGDPAVDPDHDPGQDPGQDPDVVPGPTLTPDAESSPLPAPAPEPPSPASAPGDGATADYVVVAGDSLWRIAARTLEQQWGRAPRDAEVAPFWEQVITVNREHLAEPDNPDLLFPGQQLTLPTPPAVPGASVTSVEPGPETAGRR